VRSADGHIHILSRPPSRDHVKEISTMEEVAMTSAQLAQERQR